MNLFEYINEPLKLNKNVCLIEFFGGIGSQKKAIGNVANIVKHYLVEVDINATISHAAIHHNLNEHLKTTIFPSKENMVEHLEKYGWWSNEKPYDIKKLKLEKLKKLFLSQKLTNNLGNVYNIEISKLNEIVKNAKEKGLTVIFTWSTPCQDFSLAGKLAGFNGYKGNLTQVSLDVFEELDNKPDVLIFENVKNIMSSSFIGGFNEMRNRLVRLGYRNYTLNMNSKNYGTAQNRERVFIVSIKEELLDGYEYVIPKSFPLEKRLKDYLEDEVDEKYYLSNKTISRLVNDGDGFSSKIKNGEDIAVTIISSQHKNPRGIDLIEINLDKYENGGLCGLDLSTKQEHCQRLWSENGVSPAILTKNDHTKTVIKIKNNTKKGYESANVGDSINIEHLKSETRRGRVGKSVAQTLTTQSNQATLTNDLRIRKLTERETWRLMEFSDEDFDNASIHMSSAALFKQSGNSIVVKTFEEIVKNLFDTNKF